MTERRQHPRLRSLIGGHITFNNGYSKLDCVLRNISSGGAMITCGESVPLPHMFDLVLPSKGRHLRVRLVWRATDHVGLAVVPAAA
jgi:hypothetical protein